MKYIILFKLFLKLEKLDEKYYKSFASDLLCM